MSYLALAKQVKALIRTEARGVGAPLGASTPPAVELVRNLLPMPLGEFAREGMAIAIRVPWYGEMLWFAPSNAEAVVLEREGIHRGRIWTAAELLDLFGIRGLTRDQLITVARAKLEFAGDVVLVTRMAESITSSPASRPCGQQQGSENT
jgi:hypothetical protein